ncbi:MAG: peptidoglycan DD-metalloendopeptidase family protein [Bacteroidales bacterium]|nr:peptidoglycan DD-metalloendopeptidase family protein [Bacteroidales bacterium]HOY38556.1 peptidoglycan DD-metalloendopeptidase family protein [Bacteroidales bacterium]HQP03545.1 peptidoglycan DD-metalloendopeptidase family protein [Bacteroidales bacterium]
MIKRIPIAKAGIFLMLFCLMASVTFSQSRKELENKKKKVLQDIDYTNKLLKENEAKKVDSYNNLLLINKKVESRQELILSIGEELAIIDEHIDDNKMVLDLMQEDLKRLKDEYAEMIYFAYKNRNTYSSIMFILSSEDFNQAYRRLMYLQQYSDYRKRQVLAIQSTQLMIENQIAKLDALKAEKQALLGEKNAEKEQLKEEQQQQSKTLNKYKNKEAELKKQLKKQQESAAQLQREIEKMIAEEVNKSSGGKSNTYVLTPSEKLVSTNFANNKGKLPWPVERGVIVSSFGKHAHPVLENVTIDNAGIDISTTEGAVVRAVFEGEVRRVFTLPGAQNAVIIRHGNYLSVYTHIAKVYVNTGDKVTTKQAIGSVYTDKEENKTIVHLEIWYESSKQNPASWLAK